MTIASAFVPQQPEPASPDPRPQEPSMEDILASIRRIIADDQTQGARSGFDAPQRDIPSLADAAPEPEKVAESPPAVSRGRQRPRNGYEGRVDLASIPGAAFAESPPSDYEERRLTSNEAEGPAAPEPDGDRQEIPPRAAYRPLAENGAAAPQQSPSYRNGQDPSSSFQSRAIDRQVTQVEYATLAPSAPGSVEQEEDSLPPEESAGSGDALISPALGASVMSAFETLAATVVLQNTEMLERTMRELLRPLVKTWLDENLPTLVERLVRNEIERVARGGRG